MNNNQTREYVTESREILSKITGTCEKATNKVGDVKGGMISGKRAKIKAR